MSCAHRKQYLALPRGFFMYGLLPEWLPFLSGIIISFIIGYLWFSPIMFGLKWMEAQHHRKPAEFKKVLKPLIFLVLYLIFVSILMAHLVESQLGYFFSAVLLSLVFSTSRISTGYFYNISMTPIIIDVCYHIIAICTITLCYALL